MGELDIFNYDWRKEKPPSIHVGETKEELLEIIANRFLELVSSILTQKNKKFFSVIMGGGRTPKELNKNIVKFSTGKKIDWNRVIIFFSDERCVSPGHSDSNYKLIFDTLIEPLEIPHRNISRIFGELGPEKAVSDYHKKLIKFSTNKPFPVFDLALLGFGADGHTASLFPGSRALKESRYLAAAPGKGPEGLDRVTVTFPVFNAAKNVWLMAAGAEKAHAFHSLLQGNYDPLRFPAQGISPRSGNLIYWIDSTVRDGARISIQNG
jgi:6-phosphogluconolactonase